MEIVMIVLRLIHILSGVFWGGTAFFLVSFLQPAVKAAGPEGGKVMQRLALSSFPTALPAIASLTVLSGAVMYWLNTGGLQLNIITTGTGLGFTFGSIAGLIALVIGLTITAPAIRRSGDIAKEMMASGAPPSPEQMQEIQRLQMRIANGAVWNAIFLALAVAGMAVARYL